ncbi:MAG: N-6 DNA methylase [Bacteroidales bacterium]
MECLPKTIDETFELLYNMSGNMPSQKKIEISKNLINTIVELINPQLNETVLDPFCKEGELLRASLQHLHEKVDHYSQKCGWSDVFIQDKKLMIECTEIFGIERNPIIAKVAKAKMIINQNGREKIYCDHILNSRNHWKFDTIQEVNFGKFDIVISIASFLPNEETNDEALLQQYELGYVWRKKGEVYIKTKKLKKKEKLQILFIEQCLKLVKKHGKMGLILPEVIFYTPQYNYLWYYILQNNNLQYTLNLGKFNISQRNRNQYGAIIIEKNSVQGETQNHFIK